MLKNFDNLGFVIGLFFMIISVVILLGWIFASSIDNYLNLYCGIFFFIFGFFMFYFNRKAKE